MNSIPADALVSIEPAVVSAGGSPLSLNGLANSQNAAIPAGAILSFPSLLAVQNFFGATTPEAERAGIYFGGFTNSDIKPGAILFSQFNTVALSAYVRGGSVAGLSLAQLQALNGTLVVAVDGLTVTSAAINLASATSPSNAAALIQTGLQTTGNVFAGTGSQAAGVVTIASTVSGSLSVGDTLSGAGVEPASTIISFGTYTVLSGVGTVNVGTSGTVSLGAVDVTYLPTVAYDSQRAGFVITSPTTGTTSTLAYPTTGALATGLNLTAATGAVLSQGAAANTAGTVSAYMTGIINQNTNWFSFSNVEEPADAIKLAFSAWTNSQNATYKYVQSDSNAAVPAGSAPESWGNIVETAGYIGTVAIYDSTGGDIAFFEMGSTASINPTETNGAIDFAYKGQSGLTVSITDETSAENCIANGYNFYGQYATAATQFQFYQPGSVSGDWDWDDSYTNQRILNASLQLSILTLLATVKKIPYNQAGYALIRSACGGPIQQALLFGSIVSGVELSPEQIAEVNNQAGVAIDQVLFAVGYYLQILDPGSVVRGQRGSPACNLWYTDGGSVQQIQLASIDVQ
jgi:hypothetical protein